jgi:hypothetical protein
MNSSCKSGAFYKNRKGEKKKELLQGIFGSILNKLRYNAEAEAEPGRGVGQGSRKHGILKKRGEYCNR